MFPRRLYLTLVEATSLESGQYRLRISNEVNEVSTETALVITREFLNGIQLLLFQLPELSLDVKRYLGHSLEDSFELPSQLLMSFTFLE